MNRRVRWMAFLLVASLLATILAACGAAPAGGGETVASEAAASTAAVPSAETEPSVAAEPSAAAESTAAEPSVAAEPSAAAAESAAPAAAGNVKELTIIWAQWDPANYLQQLVQQYEEETGVAVKVVQEPWGSFYNRAFAEFAAQGTAYDMVVGDSQWLGQGATQGHYVELTDVFNSDLNGEALAPATVTAYAEYPKGSGSYWAYPTEGDADGWAYRKDLFENPDEQAAFKEKYGYDLAVPKTWTELRDIAEFFTRPDQNLYGLSIYTQKDYDAITMGFENVMFSYGADWGDPRPTRSTVFSTRRPTLRRSICTKSSTSSCRRARATTSSRKATTTSPAARWRWR